MFRLFNYAKPAFVLVCVFVLWYLVLFYKKMDMMLFPYNNMFSEQIQEAPPTTYFVKMNGQFIPYSHFMYWKKDFLEQAGYKFQDYISKGKKNHVEQFILEKSWSPSLQKQLVERLTPSKLGFSEWVIWYATFANKQIPSHAQFELVACNAIFNKAGSVKFQYQTIEQCSLP